MVQFRDIQLKRQAREAQKQNKLPFKRAVLTDEFGNQTSTAPLDDVWAVSSERRVWYMHEGAVQPAQILCRKVSDPYVGLGVIIGYADGSNQLEVLSDDFFLTGTGDPTGWASTAPRDFEPGGLKQMWVYTKVITPLATYPGTGLAVNIIAGDYPYTGERKTFAGSLNFALTQNPNAGEHYLAGLYLDAANTLQVVYGASVVVATTPPEPSWPAGAFRLSAVRVNDTQTSIDFADDVFDRRMAWSNEQAGGWPFANVLTVSTTDPDADYTTIALAFAGAGAGDVILLDAGTYTLTAQQAFGAAITLMGQGPETIINCATNSISLLLLNSAGAALRNLKITHSGAGILNSGVYITANATVENVTVTLSGAATANYAVLQQGGTATLTNVNATASGATTNHAYRNDTGDATVTINGGSFSGAQQDIYGERAASFLNIYGALLAHNTVSYTGAIERSGNTSFERGRPNPVINGSFLVWQRGTSFAAIANGAYSADGWSYGKSGVMVHTVSQSSDAPTVAQAGMLVPYTLLVDCTTIDGTIAAGDFAFIRHKVEGFNFLHLAQRQFTLSFWVKATKTGVYCVAFSNSGTDRTYVAEYTINTTATWEYKTVTVSASPSAGTWDYTTGIGLSVTFTLATGSTYQTTANAWQTGGFLGTSNQVNACDDTANNFQLALVKLEPGAIATPFTLPDREQERGRCYRYAYVLDATNTVNQFQGAKTTTTVINMLIPAPVPMRAAPTLSHNITGYTAGAPGTTTVALVNYAVNNFFTITGALTVALSNANIYFASVEFTAGTSWSDTAGDLATLRVGPSVVAVLSADL